MQLACPCPAPCEPQSQIFRVLLQNQICVASQLTGWSSHSQLSEALEVQYARDVADCLQGMPTQVWQDAVVSMS